MSEIIVLDRKARDIAAALIRDFQECRIDNDDFVDNYPLATSDLAVERIRERLWFYFDDISNHKLVGQYSLDKEGLELFNRCTAFLLSDREYEWPPRSFIDPWGLLNWLPWIAKWRRSVQSDWEKFGDPKAWPFRYLDDYQAELKKTEPHLKS